MKQLTWKIVIPLTVISFTVFTKWWYVLIIDAPDTMMFGFPLPYVCNGWHTSLSLQIFVAELMTDLLTYFSIWFIAVFIVHKFVMEIRAHKVVTVLLWSVAGLFSAGLILMASNPDNIFYFKKPFDIEIVKTGYKLIWSENPQLHLDKNAQRK